MSALAETLEKAEAGGPELSRAVFLALGGEMREGPTSKQGGEIRARPYWPGQSDPCYFEVHFTTNLNAVAHYLLRRNMWWGVSQSDGRAHAFVEGSNGEGATPALALCAALVRHKEEAR